VTASPPPTNLTLETWESASLTGQYADYANLTLTGGGWATGTGNAYDNVIRGNDHPNYLDGGAGDDTLYGGSSIDHAAGHVIPRGDTFIIHAGEGNDTIMDFTPGVAGGDVISLPGFDFRSFDQVMQTATQLTSGGVLFSFSNGQTLTVHGSMADGAGTRDLLVSDFIAAGADFDLTASITDIALQPDGNGGTVAVLSGTAEANSWVYVKDPTTENPDAINDTVDPQALARVDATGVWHFTTGPLSAGAHTLAVASIQAAYSDTDQEWHYFQFSTSAPKVVTVGAGDPGDTTPPDAPSLLLDAASDTGRAGDGLTLNNMPTLHGTAEAGSTVTVYDTDGTTVLGRVEATDGNWSITPVNALALGNHHLTATATDGAGLTSGASALDLTITASRAAADFPTAGFDSAYYLAANPDVAAAGVDALQHYQQFGWHEGRAPDALFDVGYYLNHNPDVAAAGIDPLQHYEQYGWHEGRSPSALFDASYYLSQNPDVLAAGMDPLQHYLQYGSGEGRNPDAMFDTAYYLARNPDVAAAGIDPLTHYEQYGWHEGRDPSAAFSSSAYLAANPDVLAAGVDPLQHYLEYGIPEHRDLGLG